MTARKKLLFIAPVVPNPTGSGTSIRAAMLLQSVAAQYDVFIVVAPLEKPSPSEPLPPMSRFVRDRSGAVRTVSLLAENDPSIDDLVQIRDRSVADDDLVAFFQARMKSSTSRSSGGDAGDLPFRCAMTAKCLAEDLFSDITFDAILVMKSHLLPFAFRVLGAPTRPVCIVDLDDVESTTHRRVSALHAKNGAMGMAAVAIDEAVKFDAFERKYLPQFDLVLVCSTRDRDEVSARVGISNIKVVPNAIPTLQTPRAGQVLPSTDFLFVGSLGYLPNADAIAYFCRDILPGIRDRLGRDPTFQVVGRDPPNSMKRLAQIPGLRMYSDATDLAPHYDAAHVCVVPLRAGGGTRLKILEAFGYKKPVVSTSLGAEGIDVLDGEHMLLADDAPTFADACCRLVKNPLFGRQLAERAFNLVQSRYTYSHICPLAGEIIAAATLRAQ